MNLTMKEFRAVCKKDFLAAIEKVYEEIDELHSEESMKEMAKEAIDEDEFLLAAHICKGIWEEGASSDAWYKWDRTAGTMCSICGINDGQELYEAFVDYCKDFSAENEVPWYSDSDEYNEED